MSKLPAVELNILPYIALFALDVCDIVTNEGPATDSISSLNLINSNSSKNCIGCERPLPKLAAFSALSG